MSSSSNSSFNSVILEDPKWTKLEDNHPLYKLRSMFWGRRVEDDAIQWRRSHPDVQDDDTNDIGSECYILDTGLKTYAAKLWVRRDYSRIYEYCKRRDEGGPIAGVSPSVVITGQPGVGKSFWITYAVRRRLGEELPFLWYIRGQCYLFVKDGVYTQGLASVVLELFVQTLWTFVDADGSPLGVPERLLGPNVFIMFTTTPKEERWKTLSKTTACSVIVMNTWSQEEIRRAAEIWGLTDAQKRLAQSNFEELGPTPRLCLHYAKDPDVRRDYVKRHRSMINSITIESLRKLVTLGDPGPDGQSHAIFVMKRYDIDDLKEAYMAPMTAKVEMKIMNHFVELQRLELINLYHTFAPVDGTKVVAGLLYETLAHRRVEEGITLTLKPMERVKKRINFHCNVRGAQQAPTSMDVDTPEMPITIPANTPFIYEELASVDPEPNRLYVPRARNQAEFDSFVIVNEYLHLLQFTVSGTHGLTPKVEELLREMIKPGVPAMENWRFIFITPIDCDVTVIVPSVVNTFLVGVPLYSAHLDIDQN